jgi:hypothetical protein
MEPLTKLEQQLIVMGLVGIASHAPPETHLSMIHAISSAAEKLGLVDALRDAVKDFNEYSLLRAEERGAKG